MTDKMTAEQDELGIIADIIYEAGWRCIADAQHAGLQAAIPMLRQALTAPGVPEGCPDDIRAQGLTVAVHNDYRLNGQRHTFWLFVDEMGMSYKGEGPTDADALNQVRALLTTSPAPAEPFKHSAELHASRRNGLPTPAPTNVNYVDAFNGDVPFPAPGQSLEQACAYVNGVAGGMYVGKHNQAKKDEAELARLRDYVTKHREAAEIDAVEMAELRERVKELEELLLYSMRLQVGNTAIRYGAFVMKRGGNSDLSDAIEFLREEAVRLRGGSDA